LSGNARGLGCRTSPRGVVRVRRRRYPRGVCRGTWKLAGLRGLAATIVLASLSAAPSASAAVSCAFDSGTGAMVVGVGAGDTAVTVSHDGSGQIEVRDTLGATQTCAPDTPTLANTQTISVTDNVPAQNTSFTIDLGPPPTVLPGPAVTIAAGNGDDSLHVLDGFPESVDCGAGNDTVVTDDPGFDSFSTCPVAGINYAPNTTVVGGPADGVATNGSSPVYPLAASEPAGFEYTVDGGPWNPCPAACSVGALADGSHQILFRATDSTSLTERTPASRTVLVDTVPPAIRITSGPDGPTNNTTPSFEFAAEPGATVNCSVDDGGPGPCSGPNSDTTGPLADGAHKFGVRAVDAAGNVATDERAFTVDTFIRTAIRLAPPERGTRRTVVYKFRAEQLDPAAEDPTRYAEEPGATFVCRLDDRSLRPCSSPVHYTHLKHGKHRFRVIATDLAGNVDPTPATDTFRIARHRHR
jgi:hypothetical protein